MKKTSKSQERNRGKSIDGNATCRLAGILKKPSKLKLKNQRSVRFEEPEISYPTTVSVTSSVVEQVMTSPSNVQLSNSPSKSRFSSTSPVKFCNNKEPQFCKSQNESFNPTPVKIIKIAKLGNQNFKESPKSAQKVLKLDCRDDRFYSKLNFFLNVKGSTSPGRREDEVRDESVGASKKKINFVKNRLYEDTAKVDLSITEKKSKGNKGTKLVRGSYLLN